MGLTVKDKLGDIVEFGNDAMWFIRVSVMLKQFEFEALAGDPKAEQIIDIVNKFHKLVMFAKEKQ